MLENLIKSASIQEFIDYVNSLDISHDKLYLKARYLLNGDRITINFSWLLEPYYEYILSRSTLTTYTEDNFRSYLYQPKKLSLDTYQTMEFWSMLMRINGITSILEFNKLQLFIPSPTQIFDIINEILILEKSRIDHNLKTLI